MIDALHSLTETGENLSDLLRTWRAAWPGMGVLILLPEAETARIPALQAACREAEVPMLGAVFPALITDRGFAVRGGWLLRFDTMPPAFLVADLDDDAGDAARTIAARVEPHLRPDAATDAAPMLFMIFDAMLPAIGSILSGLFCELGTRIRYAGVNAGSETFQPMPCLFDRDRLVGAGMIGLLLDASAQVAVSHGYPVTRSLMSATSTRGNRVDRIDGRPAFDVYRDVIRAEFDIDLTHANFYDYAVHYPFGLVTAIDVLVRIPVAYTEDGALICVGEVPPDSKLRLLRAPALDSCMCIADIAGRLSSRPIQGRPMLAFYCAGRRMHFGVATATEELARLQSTTGASTLVGALTLGEVDSLPELDFPRFHNATVVCVAD